MMSALAFLLAAAPAAAQIEPASSVRVEVTTAVVSGLDCRRRPFAWENTRTVAGWYRYMAGQMVTEGWDPRPIVQGLASSVLMLPLMVAAPPSDAVAAPFRRTCAFTLVLGGKLTEWAGASAGAKPLSAEAANLVHDEIPGVRKASWEVFKASTTADAAGVYALELPARVGRSRQLPLRWRVDGQEAGQLLLERQGKLFQLSEPDPGFGVGAREMEPLLITPSSSPRP